MHSPKNRRAYHPTKTTLQLIYNLLCSLATFSLMFSIHVLLAMSLPELLEQVYDEDHRCKLWLTADADGPPPLALRAGRDWWTLDNRYARLPEDRGVTIVQRPPVPPRPKRQGRRAIRVSGEPQLAPSVRGTRAT